MKMISEDFVTKTTKVKLTWIKQSGDYSAHLEIREVNGPIHRIIPENQEEYNLLWGHSP